MIQGSTETIIGTFDTPLEDDVYNNILQKSVRFKNGKTIIDKTDIVLYKDHFEATLQAEETEQLSPCSRLIIALKLILADGTVIQSYPAFDQVIPSIFRDDVQ